MLDQYRVYQYFSSTLSPNYVLPITYIYTQYIFFPTVYSINYDQRIRFLKCKMYL